MSTKRTGVKTARRAAALPARLQKTSRQDVLQRKRQCLALSTSPRVTTTLPPPPASITASEGKEEAVVDAAQAIEILAHPVTSNLSKCLGLLRHASCHAEQGRPITSTFAATPRAIQSMFELLKSDSLSKTDEEQAAWFLVNVTFHATEPETDELVRLGLVPVLGSLVARKEAGESAALAVSCLCNVIANEDFKYMILLARDHQALMNLLLIHLKGFPECPDELAWSFLHQVTRFFSFLFHCKGLPSDALAVVMPWYGPVLSCLAPLIVKVIPLGTCQEETLHHCMVVLANVTESLSSRDSLDGKRDDRDGVDSEEKTGGHTPQLPSLMSLVLPFHAVALEMLAHPDLRIKARALDVLGNLAKSSSPAITKTLVRPGLFAKCHTLMLHKDKSIRASVLWLLSNLMASSPVSIEEFLAAGLAPRLRSIVSSPCGHAVLTEAMWVMSNFFEGAVEGQLEYGIKECHLVEGLSDFLGLAASPSSSSTDLLLLGLDTLQTLMKRLDGRPLMRRVGMESLEEAGGFEILEALQTHAHPEVAREVRLILKKIAAATEEEE